MNNALAREDALLREKNDLLQRHAMMTQEFEHRLFNSLQLIVSLLWLQSRAASTPEAALQLNIAADRVAALGRVHRQLHVLDHQERVEFKQYIHHLCEDLSGLLFQDGAKRAIAVEGVDVEIPSDAREPWHGLLQKIEPFLTELDVGWQSFTGNLKHSVCSRQEADRTDQAKRCCSVHPKYELPSIHCL